MLVREYIKERIIEEARYIVETNTTVRKTAKVILSSKSSIHKDVTVRIKEIDKTLYEQVNKVLQKNLAERHIRGGIATRNKYILLNKHRLSYN
jgi:putative DeoR family transcriptional regulator (stage III sporulation protein D)